jgi:[glutamine synthetase] adenylyltransferase / [glutamine synthetase]-adenylyl-L-tyrosine phosphorylase
MSAAGALRAALEHADRPPVHLPDWQTVAANIRCLHEHLAGIAAREELLADCIDQALEVPAPAVALNNLERCFSGMPEDEKCPFASRLANSPFALEVLVSLFGESQYLSETLIREPALLWWLADADTLRRQRSPAQYRIVCDELLDRNSDRASRKAALCVLKSREMLRIGCRDIMRLASIEEITRETSDLAEAVIRAASRATFEEMSGRYGIPLQEQPGLESPDDFRKSAERAPVAGMGVIGMGKLGGRELNFSSDIDLIFIYDAEGYTSGTLKDGRKAAQQTNHFFFTKMGEAIVAFLSERAPEGHLYRVDMRLRPEGKYGPLARSLESFVQYLEEQARDWERLAYLKARVLVGPATLAERLYRFTGEFVFAETPPDRIVREVERLKVMIDRDVAQSDLYTREVKRGYGGIREIEFIIAAMQIIYGRQHRALRVRNIFLAIERLREVNLMSADEADFYFGAYEFLRFIEHRLQMAEEHQTHTIPSDPGRLEILARQCGFDTTAGFLERYRVVTDGVHRRFSAFFEQDIEDMDREQRDMLLVLNRDAPPEQAREALARRGIADPNALPLIHQLAFGTREVFITAEGQRSFEQMLPSLLRLAASAPAPHRVLPHMHSFMLSIKGITYYYELIAQHPEILNLLTTLFGTSDRFSHELIAHPQFFDTLISSQIVYEFSSHEEQLARVEGALRVSRKLERRLVLLRRAAKFEMLLTALRYLLKVRTLAESLAEQSRTADVIVHAAMPLAAARTVDRLASIGGKEHLARSAEHVLNLARENFAVIALGKYGGLELGFFGDLDVVFVYDDSRAGGEDGEFYSILSDSLSRVLSEQIEEGRIFELDARLRPHGKNSPLATPLSQYIEYLEKEAQTWEHQSFLRARHVFGRAGMTSALKEASLRTVRAMDPARVRADMLSMRDKLAASVPSSERNREYKRAPGGVTDVEFVLQFLAIAGEIEPATLPPSYLDQLDAVTETPRAPVSAIGKFRRGYSLIRMIDSGVRLVTGAPASTLPVDPAHVRSVERMLRIDEGLLEKHLRQIMTWNREAYLEILAQS